MSFKLLFSFSCAILISIISGFIIYNYLNRKEISATPIQLSSIDLRNKIVIWASGCPHFSGDYKHDSSSIIQNANDIDTEIDWDVFLLLGDLNNGPNLPNQHTTDLYKLFLSNLKNHAHSDVFCLMGNHDSYTPDSSSIENPWFRKVIDPIGEFPEYSENLLSNRNHKISGSYDHYKIEIGNEIVILMLSDRNDLPYPVGRGNSGKGFPAGAITRETFNWWIKEVEQNKEKIIFTCHHHLLKETTAGTGEYEGQTENLHGGKSEADAKASSFLYFIGAEESDEISEYINQNPGCINYWLGTHSHLSPFAIINNRKMTEVKDGVNFINVGKLFRFDGKDASSRIFICDTITKQTDSYIYLHWSKTHEKGWYTIDESSGL